MSAYTLSKTASVYGVILNYEEELLALAEQFNLPPYQQAPKKPVLFIKTPNTYNVDNQVVHYPQGERLFAGPTLGVVFKQEASRVTMTDAWDYVAGLIVCNDFSLFEANYYRPAIKQKCRDGFLAVANHIVQLDDIDDVDNLVIATAINGVSKQQANTSSWVRDIPRLMTEVSQFMTFYPGDVLLTGSPANRVEVKNQDQVTITIENIGSVSSIVEEDA